MSLQSKRNWGNQSEFHQTSRTLLDRFKAFTNLFRRGHYIRWLMTPFGNTVGIFKSLRRESMSSACPYTVHIFDVDQRNHKIIQYYCTRDTNNQRNSTNPTRLTVQRGNGVRKQLRWPHLQTKYMASGPGALKPFFHMERSKPVISLPLPPKSENPRLSSR